MTTIPDVDIEEVRELMSSFRNKDLLSVINWLNEKAPNEKQLIGDLQKQHFVYLLEESTF